MSFDILLQENGVLLSTGEYALLKADVLDALKALENKNICILGGDVYEEAENNEYVPTYDNWYFNRENEISEDVLKRSIAKAVNYINQYDEANRIIRYVVVIKDFNL